MTPQQQADEMARKCAENIDLVQEVQGVKQTHELQGIITQSIPLVQLLGCVESLEALLNDGDSERAAKALTNLDRAMKGEKV